MDTTTTLANQHHEHHPRDHHKHHHKNHHQDHHNHQRTPCACPRRSCHLRTCRHHRHRLLRRSPEKTNRQATLIKRQWSVQQTHPWHRTPTGKREKSFTKQNLKALANQPSPGPSQEPGAPPVEVKLKEESDSDRPPPAATGLATADRGKLVGPVVVPSPPPPAAPAAPEEPGKDEPANDPHQTPKVHINPAGSPLAPGAKETPQRSDQEEDQKAREDRELQSIVESRLNEARSKEPQIGNSSPEPVNAGTSAALEISLAWEHPHDDGRADLDLWVVPPEDSSSVLPLCAAPGYRIGIQHTKRCSGGELDVDSKQDTPRPVENVVFQKRAPCGKYRVIVNTYAQFNGGYKGVQPEGYPWTSAKYKALTDLGKTRMNSKKLAGLKIDVPFRVLVKSHPHATLEIVRENGKQVAGADAIAKRERGVPIVTKGTTDGKPESRGAEKWTKDVLEFTYAPPKNSDEYAELIQPKGAGDAWTQATEKIVNKFKNKKKEEQEPVDGAFEVILSWKHPSKLNDSVEVGLTVSACADPQQPSECPAGHVYTQHSKRMSRTGQDGSSIPRTGCRSGNWYQISAPPSGVQFVTFLDLNGVTDYSEMKQFRIHIEFTNRHIRSEETHAGESVEYLVSVKQDGTRKIVWKGRANALLQGVTRAGSETMHHTFVGQFSLNKKGTICGVHPVASQTGPKPFPVCERISWGSWSFF
ncbi:unnamed protein product [Amoebophrya sp. A25]|nr:unnamed protein product [Amoebophrya sp. A25]|eukprot:GSA25T00010767001.1